MAHESDDLTADVTAQVKWYNPNKGFGFVQPNGGGGDAFLHASVVAQAGHQTLGEGDVLRCDIAAGPRGPQVVTIHHVERSSQPRGDWTRPDDNAGPGEVVEGSVKFFDATKGFGFVAPDGGGKDIFISARTLNRCGIASLETDQRVRVTTRIGQKGPMAEDLTLI
jgi:CspA family cold shock protein